MTTFADIQRQIAELQAQAATLRAQELSSVIADVKGKISMYGLTADDLGFKLEPTVIYREPEVVHEKETKTRAPIAPKYKHPDNEELVWTGQGIMPKWMTVYLDTHKDKTKYDLLIDQSKREETEKADKKKAEEKAAEKAAEAKVEPVKEEKKTKTEEPKVEEPAVVQTKRVFGR